MLLPLHGMFEGRLWIKCFLHVFLTCAVKNTSVFWSTPSSAISQVQLSCCSRCCCVTPLALCWQFTNPDVLCRQAAAGQQATPEMQPPIMWDSLLSTFHLELIKYENQSVRFVRERLIAVCYYSKRLQTGSSWGLHPFKKLQHVSHIKFGSSPHGKFKGLVCWTVSASGD